MSLIINEKRKPRICLDPGHGGNRPGAIGPTGLRESEVALKVAQSAAWHLSDQDLEVVLTRSLDEHISLSRRVEIANEHQVDCFVSIHCNSFTGRGPEGIETLYGAIWPQSKALAHTIQQSLISGSPGHRDRGIKRSPSPAYPRRLHVLSVSDWPAVLTELEFISNPEQERWLADENTQTSLGWYIARGIIQWLRSLPQVVTIEEEEAQACIKDDGQWHTENFDQLSSPTGREKP